MRCSSAGIKRVPPVNDRKQKHGRGRRGSRHSHGAGLGMIELRQDQDHGDDRQILDNQHADHDAAGQAAEGAPRRQSLEDHGRAR